MTFQKLLRLADYKNPYFYRKMKKTLFDKVWDKHVIQQIDKGPDVLFIDRHMVHEVTSPVAFLGLKNRNIKVMYPERTFATADHNTPTINQHLPVQDSLSAKQLDALEKNASEHGISFWGLGLLRLKWFYLPNVSSSPNLKK